MCLWCSLLNAFDRIVQGKIAVQGTPAYLIENGFDFITRDENESNTRDSRKSSVFGRRMSECSSRKSSIHSNTLNNIVGVFESGEKDEDKQCHFVTQLEEGSSKGVSGSIAMSYLKSGANLFILPVFLCSFLLTQITASAADIWISIW